MAGAISIGTTGLAAAAKQMDVIGNNLANSNTLGFKSGNIYFASMLDQSLTSGGGNMQAGQGVQVQAIENSFAQGSFETTSSGTDMAIDGEGFFIMNDSDGTRFYTRAGACHLDKDGYLVDTNGYKVQGHTITSSVENNALTDLRLGSVQSAPMISTTIGVAANLDANTTNTVLPAYNYQTAQSVYDSLGSEHILTINYTKTAAGSWTATPSITDGTLTSGAPVLTFNSSGTLTAATNTAMSFTLTNGAATPLALTFNLLGTDHLELTQYAGSSVTKQLYSDGYPSGSLKNISIDESGVVSGFFTNGQTQDIARIMLAGFPSPVGLSKIGNYFTQSFSSGQAVYNSPQSAGLGGIQSSTLETSNTDTAKEFMNMIAAQRAYQANARVITTADTMLAELMAIKR